MPKLICLPLLFAAIAFFAAAPAAAQPAGDMETTLANGLRVIVVQDRLAPVVTTVMTYGAGANDDTVPGVAHATEHMLFRGFAGLSAGEFADIGARMGGVYNAETTNEYTRYYFTAPSQYIGLILKLEAMRMTGAWIADSEWASERGAIEQEIAARQSNPTYAVSAQLRSRMFGTSPLANSAGGTIEGLRGLTASQIRVFYQAWYHPNNATLVVAGDVVPKSVLTQVHALFDAIPRVKLPVHRSVAVASPSSAVIEERAHVPDATVAFVYRYPSLRSPDYAAGLVLQTALDDPRGALAELTASGKTHGAGMASGAYPQVGLAFVSAGAPKNSPPQLTQAVLDDTITSYLRTGVPAELIDDAKRRIGASRAFSLASIQGLAFAWADAAQAGEASPLDMYRRIETVSANDVNRVLREYLAPKQRIVVVLQPDGTVQKAASIVPAATENVKPSVSTMERAPLWALAYFKNALRPSPALEQMREFVLPNGIHLVVLPQDTAPVVVLTGTVKMNQTLHAPADKQGVLDLTAALQSWGGGGYDRKGFAAAAAAIPAGVGVGSTFGLQAQTKDFDRALALLAAVQLHPAFPADALNTVRAQFVQSLGDEQSQADWAARLAMEKALYPPADPVRKHPTPQSVRNVTLDDVKAWYARAYRPDLTTIAVVGNVSPAYVREEMQKYFGSWRVQGSKPDFHYPNIVLNHSANVEVPSSDERQSTVTLTELLPIYQKDADAPALEIADTILAGEGIGSTLFRDLRKDTGYVYSVDSTLDIGKVRSTYQFSFASDQKNAAIAAARLLEDLHHLQITAPSADELVRAKETLLARSVLPLSSYGSIANVLLSAASGTRNTATGLFQRGRARNDILTVTPEQVRAAMARWVRIDDFVRVTIVPERPR